MILILGSSHENTATYYKKLNLEQSKLITLINENYSIGHTSPQDTGTYENLNKIALKADKIYFTYPAQDEFDDEIFYHEYLDWIKEFHFKYKKISNWKNIELDGYNWNLNLPVLTSNDAVFIGCSFTEGVGIDNPECKYANIVSRNYNLNCINLGKGSSSNSYFFEVFSQLNFTNGQLVVIQLTVLERLRYCSEKDNLKHIQLAHLPSYNLNLIDVYNNKFLFYETLKSIRLIQSIANEKNLKLAIWLDNYKEEHQGHYTRLQQRYLYNLRSFVPAYLMQDYCVDKGTDDLHPGVESNKNIANTLIYFIDRTYNEV